MMRKRGDQAGLDMWPHRLRHQFAHLWLKDGGQERDLMRLAGWTTPAMLARYGAAAATQRALDAHRKHSPGDKF
jgi:integrase